MDLDEQRRQRQNASAKAIVVPYMRLLRGNMIVSFTVVLLVVASPLTSWASVDTVLEACASTVAIFWVITGYTYLQKSQENEVMDGQPIRKVMLQNTLLTLAGCIFLNVWMIKMVTV